MKVEAKEVGKSGEEVKFEEKDGSKDKVDEADKKAE